MGGIDIKSVRKFCAENDSHLDTNPVFESTASLNEEITVYFSGFRHQILSGSLIRLE